MDALVFMILFVIKLIPEDGSSKSAQLAVHHKPKWISIPDEHGEFHLVDVSKARDEPDPMTAFDHDINTIFHLCTRKYPDCWQVKRTVDSLKEAGFNSSHPVRFIIHGWRSDTDTNNMRLIKDKFLEAGEHNVILIDWRVAANTLYTQAYYRLKLVADVISKFINFLVDNRYTKTSSINIVGHSLGAHIAGLTGERTKMTCGIIKTIFALDPAGPWFNDDPELEDRFDASDAEYTQAIHTNTEKWGYKKPLAHADFYPNWGKSQPGCRLDLTCSHSRSFELFAESISSKDFLSRECDEGFDGIKSKKCIGEEKISMGGDEAWSFGKNGVFYLKTNSEPPYATPK